MIALLTNKILVTFEYESTYNKINTDQGLLSMEYTGEHQYIRAIFSSSNFLLNIEYFKIFPVCQCLPDCF